MRGQLEVPFVILFLNVWETPVISASLKKIIKQSDIFTIPGIERLVRKHALPLGVDDDDNIEMIKEMVLAGLKHDFFWFQEGKAHRGTFRI